MAAIKLAVNRKVIVLVTISLLTLFVTGLQFVSQVKARADWQQKVDPWVLEATVSELDAEFLVVLDEQADLSAVDTLPTKLAKGTYVYEQLTAVAQRTQPSLIEALKSLGSEHRPYWVSNAIWVRGDARVVEALARRADVARIHANPRVKLDVVTSLNTHDSVKIATAVEWNIDHVGAPKVWASGVRGQGVIIGGQDTGYNWQHPALVRQYRGWNGSTADHNYNWHDAIHNDNLNTPPGNPCGYDSPQPCDDHGHGTHTMGTMVGDDGAGNQIGMAPNAQWIACRNMEQGWGTPATYAECYEWFIAPYPVGGDPMLDGDPAKAPHVINNSWGCPPAEGCNNPDILRTVVDNVRAAGIVTANSAGNSGPSCGTILDPAAIYDASFTVGATYANDTIAGFSSRGPTWVGNNDPAKPDISAPGVGIRSSVPGGSYGTSSGTSMAAPHVAGLVGLLLAARPDLVGNVDALEEVIKESALPLFSTDGCGGDKSDTVPNYTYGWGRIDALAAYRLAKPEPQYLIYTPIWIEQQTEYNED
ncbi:MAG: S8 family serine peptidase [Chloroflexi bacterium]|jgi:subtilisin family serine protease|nr:S8 family serine peptidase [Chloroflexota bacterium]